MRGRNDQKRSTDGMHEGITWTPGDAWPASRRALLWDTLEQLHRELGLPAPTGSFHLGPRINRERIRANWDDIHRIAASA